MKWLVLITGIATNASASILIKIAMSPPRQLPSLSQPFLLLYNLPLIAGLFLYVLTLVLYAFALSLLPLSVAHPSMTAGAIAIVALFSWAVFGESIYWTTWAGIVMIMLGVFLITFRTT